MRNLRNERIEAYGFEELVVLLQILHDNDIDINVNTERNRYDEVKYNAELDLPHDDVMRLQLEFDNKILAGV